jgi:hypothetical protein
LKGGKDEKMAWRPTDYLEEGELDNTVPGKVTGWMKFTGIGENVSFDLTGDFHRDIRGTKIQFKGDGLKGKPGCMQGFGKHQTGKAGDMTAGLEPQDYVKYCYLEWYGDANGRVVIELDTKNVTVIGTPIPASKAEPISREKQNRNLMEFAGQCAGNLG